MKNDFTHIPEEIFDWLEKHDFSSLSAFHQQEVLLHFSKEEYEELRHGVLSVKATQEEGYSARRDLRKQELLQRFDKKYQRKTIGLQLLNKPIALWKAAAVLLLLGSAGIYAALMQRNGTTSRELAAVHDTVYITKEVKMAPEMIYDTVYVGQKEKEKEKERGNVKQALVAKKEAPVKEERVLATDINIVSVKELDRIPNTQRHNSMKDDSLLKKYSFVSVL